MIKPHPPVAHYLLRTHRPLTDIVYRLGPRDVVVLPKYRRHIVGGRVFVPQLGNRIDDVDRRQSVAGQRTVPSRIVDRTVAHVVPGVGVAGRATLAVLLPESGGDAVLGYAAGSEELLKHFVRWFNDCRSWWSAFWRIYMRDMSMKQHSVFWKNSNMVENGSLIVTLR